MKKSAKDSYLPRDRQIVEAEQDLVLDAQFLLQETMDAKGITRSELAKRAGVSKARLSRLMRAEANPTLRILAALLACMNGMSPRETIRTLLPAPQKL